VHPHRGPHIVLAMALQRNLKAAAFVGYTIAVLWELQLPERAARIAHLYYIIPAMPELDRGG
jgi:hypothetical protein